MHELLHYCDFAADVLEVSLGAVATLLLLELLLRYDLYRKQLVGRPVLAQPHL